MPDKNSYTMESLTTEYIEGIEILGSYLKNSGLTLRKIVMAQHSKYGTK